MSSYKSIEIPEELAEGFLESTFHADLDLLRMFLDEVFDFVNVADANESPREIIDLFEASYQGYYDSPAAFAEEICHELGFLSDETADFIVHCIDWQKVAEQLSYDNTYITCQDTGGVNVFCNYF